jgi:hypothetical protein
LSRHRKSVVRDPHPTFLWKSDCQLIASTTADMGQ